MADYLPILSRHFSFWDKLSQQEKDLILRYTSVVQYKKGTHLQRGDSNCVGVLLLNKGILRVYMLSEEGKEITLYRLYENDVCVLSASCILQHITFDVYIDAETDVEILLINAAIFLKSPNKILMWNAFPINLQPTAFLMLCGRCSRSCL